MELLRKIRRNRGKNIEENFIEFFGRFGTSSRLTFFKVKDNKECIGEDCAQKFEVIKTIGARKNIQLRFNLILEDGSKIENILVIIFKYYY
jgi:hypothetical protein